MITRNHDHPNTSASASFHCIRNLKIRVVNQEINNKCNYLWSGRINKTHKPDESQIFSRKIGWFRAEFKVFGVSLVQNQISKAQYPFTLFRQFRTGTIACLSHFVGHLFCPVVSTNCGTPDLSLGK